MNEPSREIFEGELLGEQVALGVAELARLCAVAPERIVELVEEGVVRVEVRQSTWQFDAYAQRRVRVALRLQRDLEINLAGVAVVLNLLEELEHLRSLLGPQQE